MPVIGAIPIVMPTLTKTWITRTKTTPAATIASKSPGASATILIPRQTTSA